jgi:hypothetical protein
VNVAMAQAGRGDKKSRGQSRAKDGWTQRALLEKSRERSTVHTPYSTAAAAASDTAPRESRAAGLLRAVMSSDATRPTRKELARTAKVFFFLLCPVPGEWTPGERKKKHCVRAPGRAAALLGCWPRPWHRRTQRCVCEGRRTGTG